MGKKVAPNVGFTRPYMEVNVCRPGTTLSITSFAHQSRKIVEFVEIVASHLVGYSSYTSLVDFLDEEAFDILVTLTGRDIGLALVSRLEAAPDRCGAD